MRYINLFMINYCLVMKCWGEVTTKDICGTGITIRVLTLNVLATTDEFMSVDHKAFKTAVWEALDVTNKNQLFFSYI